MSRSRIQGNSHLPNTFLSDKNKTYSKLKKINYPGFRRIRLTYLRLLRLRGKPKTIATGLAVGIFSGCFPFFGLQTLLAIAFAIVFRGSKVAAVAATWISNPVTYVPIFIFNYKVGKFLLGIQDSLILPLDMDSLSSLATFKELGSSFILALLTGCFVVGLITSCITYFYSLAFLERWRKRKQRQVNVDR